MARGKQLKNRLDLPRRVPIPRTCPWGVRGCVRGCPWVIVNLISSRTYYHGPGPWCNFKCFFPRTPFDLNEFQDKELFYATIVVAWDIREAIFIWQDAEFNQVNSVGIN